MVNSVNSSVVAPAKTGYTAQMQSVNVKMSASFSSQTVRADRVALGQNGKPSEEQAMSMVYERAMEKLRGVVDQARADLGIPEGQALDVSAEATAGRIADFALGAFGKWRAGREELSDEDARAQFAEFIGGAINQGIGEARDILGALQALNPEIDNKINDIASLIQQRLDDFVANGVQQKTEA